MSDRDFETAFRSLMREIRGSDARRRRTTVAGIDPVEPAPGQEAGVAEALMIPGAPIKTILGGLGAAYGIAAGKDLGVLGGDANAQSAAQSRARAAEARARAEQMRAETKAGADKLQQEALAASQEEYNRAVKKAESARDFELSRNRRFSDTAMGHVWDKTGGAAPVLAGAAAGMLGRVASGGGSHVKNYALPAGEGALAGITAANIPLAYNALFTEPDNPERRGYEAYARELPPTHPRKAEWQAYAETLPQSNPVRQVANQELFDPWQAGKRILFGGLEGAGGGLLGASAARVPNALLQGAAGIPGNWRAAAARAEAEAVRAGNEIPAVTRPQQMAPQQPMAAFPAMPAQAPVPNLPAIQGPVQTPAFNPGGGVSQPPRNPITQFNVNSLAALGILPPALAAYYGIDTISQPANYLAQYGR